MRATRTRPGITPVAARGIALTEEQWQRRVMDLAKTLGWRVVHIRPLWDRTGQRMRTPYTGDSGLPDLILARRGRVLLIELKTDIGKPTLDQQAWVDAAGQNGHVLAPRDWDLARQILA